MRLLAPEESPATGGWMTVPCQWHGWGFKHDQVPHRYTVADSEIWRVDTAVYFAEPLTWLPCALYVCIPYWPVYPININIVLHDNFPPVIIS